MASIYHNTIKCIYAFACLLLLVLSCNAQDTASKKATLETRVFLDVYYAYDFSNPASHEKAAFLYNHKRHNEVNVNLALAKITYNRERTRAELGLMTGTYAQYNLAAESQVLQHVFEANAGVKVTAKNDLWVDAGIFTSHIGFESAINKDCWTLTRSILAENSPYYEAGLRLSYTTTDSKLYVAALMLNGWQRITRVEGNNTPAFGTQLTYTPSDKVSLNWSTFTGNDKPDSIKQWRYFNNLYAVWKLNNNWGLTVGLDYGLEQKQPKSSSFNKWYAPVAILRYESNSWALAARVEYYSDKQGVIVPLMNRQPYQMQGYSMNADRTIGKNALWRVEWRMFNNSHPYFVKSNGIAKSNHMLTTSVVIDFTDR